MAQKEPNIFSDLKARDQKSLTPLLFIVLTTLLVAAVGAAGYFYWQNMQLKKTPQVLAQQETQRIIAKVSRLAVLPEGEMPTVATVTDLTTLKDQPFFSKAQKGDKVLIYATAKRAILYSAALDKVIEISSIGTDQATTATTPTNTTSAATTTTGKK